MTLSGGVRRRFRITVRLSAEERNALDAAAESSALTLSDYVRCVLTGSKPLPAARKPTVEASLLARVLARLGQTSSSLSRIADAAGKAPVGVPLMPFLERELLRTLTDLKACRSQLMDALGRRAAS